MAESKTAMENHIRLLTESLQPSEEQVSHGKSVMNKVFRKLQEKSHFSIDRCILVGGTEKKTSICIKLDFDCVLYVNDVKKNGDAVDLELSFHEVVDDFQDVLLLNFDTDIQNAGDRTLMVTIDGVDLDLSIAPNVIFGEHMNTDEELKRLVLKKFESIWMTNKPLNEKKKEMYRLSPAVGPIAVQFVKQQSSFVHELARLCKYWNKTVFLELVLKNSFVSGRSSIMELLAIDAGLEEERCCFGNKSLLTAFRRFLKRVRDIKLSKLVFKNSFYDKSKVPNDIKKEPYIIDPANPYHNYLDGVREEVFCFWSGCAEETLASLHNIERGIQSVFNPQPKWSQSPLVKTPRNWVVGTGVAQSKKPSYTVNKGAPDEKYIKILMDSFTVVVKAVDTSRETQSLNHTAATVKEKVQKHISTSMIGSHVNWLPADGTHSSRECTITIPLDGSNNAVIISCDW